MPSLKALKAFDTAAGCGSFSQAAERLFVTHGAVSRLIRQLESELGVTLFDRHQDGVTLTAAGQRLRASSEMAFRLLDEGCAAVARATGDDVVVLACPGSFMMRWLIPRLEALKTACPGIMLRLQALDGPWQGRLDGIDLAIVNGDGQSPPGWRSRHLADDELGPVCTPGLAARLKVPEDLAGQRLLQVASRPDAWQDWAREQGVALRNEDVGTEFEQLSFMLEAALTGLGVAIAPRFLVAGDIAAGRLCAPFGFVRGDQDYRLLQSGSGGAPVQAVAEWLLQQAP
ncbi:LysR substrate-binding domain-containing protein [Mangrovitalea sediminis]|uniref:LysR substrate-binding domain-containing protein n=1 Tax=Mangrovitalea sediminis TaxID=1982043 RepID=UPI0013046DCD|nr:LysR substrate-binding domain-containing protein [Mangrovitalea sediminis]